MLRRNLTPQSITIELTLIKSHEKRRAKVQIGIRSEQEKVKYKRNIVRLKR